MRKIILSITILLFAMFVNAQDDGTTQYVNNGWAFVGKKEYQQAIDEFNKAIAVQPAGFPGLLGRAYTYIEMGRHAEAQTELVKLEEMYPKNAFPPLLYGWNLILQQKFAEAKKSVFDTYKKIPV